MPFVVFWIVAMVLILLEGALLSSLGVVTLALHLPVVVAIYLGIERDFATGGLLLVALLIPVEWVVAGVPGVYSMALAVVYLVMGGLRGQVQQGWGVARALAAGIGSLLHSLVMVGLFLGMGEPSLSVAVAWMIVPSVVIVAAVTVVVGRGLSRLDRMVDPRRGRSRLEFS